MLQSCLNGCAQCSSRIPCYRRKKDHGRAEAVLLAIWGGMLAEAHLAKRKARASAVKAKPRASRAFNEKEQHQRLQTLGTPSISTYHWIGVCCFSLGL